jgi:hypothetical protein
MAFHRLLFVAESPDTPWPVNASEYTAFMVRFRTGAGIDLTTAPLSRDGARWMHQTDYSACQELADNARAVGIDVVRHESARSDRRNAALLICRAFSCVEPLDRQIWRLHLGPAGVRAIGEGPDERHGLDRLAFAADPRIAGFAGTAESNAVTFDHRSHTRHHSHTGATRSAGYTSYGSHETGFALRAA